MIYSTLHVIECSIICECISKRWTMRSSNSVVTTVFYWCKMNFWYSQWYSCKLLFYPLFWAPSISMHIIVCLNFLNFCSFIKKLRCLNVNCLLHLSLKKEVEGRISILVAYNFLFFFQKHFTSSSFEIMQVFNMVR